MVLWWSLVSPVGICQPQDTWVCAVANSHAVHEVPPFTENGDVVFSVTNPHNCPHLLPHNCQHQCLPRQFPRIYESVGWLRADSCLFSIRWGDVSHISPSLGRNQGFLWGEDCLKRLWPTWTEDIISLSFFHWGLLNDDLKENVINKTAAVSSARLTAAFIKMGLHVGLCV